MKVSVFVGPTIPLRECVSLLDATYHPPVAQGDVYDAARSGTDVVAIVDGYFERLPAVWHREILWALSRGVHVFGCASMGALRAAELHAFGMVGIGAVFQAYSRGDLEDDDEVAIIHGDAASGFAGASEAMVNIRATVARAIAEGIITPLTGAIVIATAKSLHYPDRHYATILSLAGDADAPGEELAALAEWLPNGAVDQKREDARALLRHLATFRATAPGPKVVQFHFQHTDSWEQVRRQIERRPLDVVGGIDTPRGNVVLDELRLRSSEYLDVWRSALTRRLALRVAAEEGERASRPLLQHAADAFRRRHGLRTEGDVDDWLARQVWSRRDWLHALESDVLARRTAAIYEADLDRHLADELRLRGQYEALAARAAAKQEALEAHGLAEPTAAALHIDDVDLWRTFFDEIVCLPQPESLEDFAQALGFIGLEPLRRLALRELAFRRLQPESPAPPPESG